MMTTPTQSSSNTVLNFDEYEEEKKPSVQSSYREEETKFSMQDTYQKDLNQWALFLHLSQFAGYVVPLAGMIVPIAIWLAKKEEMPELDRHGKMVANWIITQFIFGLGIFMMALVGIILFPLLVLIVPMSIGLGLASIAFPIIGAIKASNGEFWPYPLTIQFLK